MADEIIQEEIQEEEVIQEEVKKEESKEEKEEVNSSEEKEFDKKGFIQKMLDRVTPGKSPEKEEEEEVKEEGELISQKFISAASELGWDDETIQDFAKDYTDEELDEMIPYLAVEEPQPEKAPVKADEKVLQEEKPNKEESEELKAVKQKLADLEEKFGAVEKEKAAKEQVDLERRVDDIFDRAGEKFKVFGITEELPTFPAGPRKGQVIPTSPEFKARMDVFAVAAKLISAGSDIDDAMGTALDWYKGKNLEKDVKRSLVKDLKRSEKKLSAKRMGKEAVKVFEDEDERKANVVREAARKKGIELEG
jgi:hypothetical protein